MTSDASWEVTRWWRPPSSWGSSWRTRTSRSRSGIPANEFLQSLQEAEGGAEETAVRWAVVINDCEKMALQLQGLPAAANVLNGKPSLRR